MTSFLEVLENDVRDVYLNLEEFAEEHTIANKKVPCVIDRNFDSENSGTISDPYYGLYKNTLTIYVDAKAIRKPEVDESLTIDGSFHKVLSVSEEQGMLVIIVSENNE